jgi:hypothetical protein
MLSRSKESSRASFSFVGLASKCSRASPAVSRSLFGGAGVRTREGKEEAAEVHARESRNGSPVVWPERLGRSRKSMRWRRCARAEQGQQRPGLHAASLLHDAGDLSFALALKHLFHLSGAVSRVRTGQCPGGGRARSAAARRKKPAGRGRWRTETVRSPIAGSLGSNRAAPDASVILLACTRQRTRRAAFGEVGTAPPAPETRKRALRGSRVPGPRARKRARQPRRLCTLAQSFK